MNQISNDSGKPQTKNQRTIWNPSDKLLKFAEDDFFLVNDAYQGCLCTGSTGSGKSSAVLNAFLRPLARSWGLLFTTTKGQDCAGYLKLLADAGRKSPVRVISPENPWTMNLLETLYRQNGTRGAGDTQGTVAAIVELLETKNRGASTGSSEARFWIDAATEFCVHSLELLAASGERIQFQGINKIIEDLPQNPEQVRNAEWQKGYLNGLINKAIARKDLNTCQQHDLEMALLYFLGRVPKMDDRLRGGVVAQVSSMVFSFLTGRISRLFDGETNISPEFCFDGGCIILDIPVHQYLSGQLVQILFKYVWQKMIQKRDIQKYQTPCALVIDEAQHFVTKSDILFTSTCRSARCCTFLLSQNLDVLQHQIGQADTEGLVGNLCTKIATSNDHGKTNIWFSSMCGQEWSTTTSTNVSMGNEGQLSSGMQDQRKYNLEPHELVKLRKPSDELKGAEAVVFRAGRPFKATGKNFVRVFLPQS